MPPDEVTALRRDLENLRANVSDGFTAVNGRLDVIHEAVMAQASRVLVPGPPWWKRIGAWMGLVRF